MNSFVPENLRDLKGRLDNWIDNISFPDCQPINPADNLIRVLLLIDEAKDDDMRVIIEMAIAYTYLNTKHCKRSLAEFLAGLKRDTAESADEGDRPERASEAAPQWRGSEREIRIARAADVLRDSDGRNPDRITMFLVDILLAALEHIAAEPKPGSEAASE